MKTFSGKVRMLAAVSLLALSFSFAGAARAATTVAAPVITFTQPKAGSSVQWKIGAKQTFRWTVKGSLPDAKIAELYLTDPTGTDPKAYLLAKFSPYFIDPITGFSSRVLSKSVTLSNGGAVTSIPNPSSSISYRVSIQYLGTNTVTKAIDKVIGSGISDASITVVQADALVDQNPVIGSDTPAIAVTAPSANQAIEFDKPFPVSFTANFASVDGVGTGQGFMINLVQVDPSTLAPLGGGILQIGTAEHTVKGAFSQNFTLKRSSLSASVVPAGTYQMTISAVDAASQNPVSIVIAPLVLKESSSGNNGGGNNTTTAKGRITITSPASGTHFKADDQPRVAWTSAHFASDAGFTVSLEKAGDKTQVIPLNFSSNDATPGSPATGITTGAAGVALTGIGSGRYYLAVSATDQAGNVVKAERLVVVTGTSNAGGTGNDNNAGKTFKVLLPAAKRVLKTATDSLHVEWNALFGDGAATYAVSLVDSSSVETLIKDGITARSADITIDPTLFATLKGTYSIRVKALDPSDSTKVLGQDDASGKVEIGTVTGTGDHDPKPKPVRINVTLSTNRIPATGGQVTVDTHIQNAAAGYSTRNTLVSPVDKISISSLEAGAQDTASYPVTIPATAGSYRVKVEVLDANGSVVASDYSPVLVVAVSTDAGSGSGTGGNGGGNGGGNASNKPAKVTVTLSRYSIKRGQSVTVKIRPVSFPAGATTRISLMNEACNTELSVIGDIPSGTTELAWSVASDLALGRYKVRAEVWPGTPDSGPATTSDCSPGLRVVAGKVSALAETDTASIYDSFGSYWNALWQ